MEQVSLAEFREAQTKLMVQDMVQNMLKNENIYWKKKSPQVFIFDATFCPFNRE